MRTLFLLLILTFLANVAFSQIGIWEYIDKKNNNKRFRLYLRKDGFFEYSASDGDGWASTKTTGKWRIGQKNIALLTSERQLTDYRLMEEVDEEVKGMKIVIKSTEKGRGPKTISRIFYNEDETALFEVDTEASIQEMEDHKKMMVAGTPQQIRHLRNSDMPKHYKCKKRGKVTSITIEFDGKELTINTTNPEANVFIITTDFAKNAAYEYMAGTQFKTDGKYIWNMNRPNVKMKKVKK